MAKGIRIEELLRQAERLKIQISRYESTAANIAGALNSLGGYIQHNDVLQGTVVQMAQTFKTTQENMKGNLNTMNQKMYEYINKMTENDAELKKAVTDYADQIDKNGASKYVFTGSDNIVGWTPNGSAGDFKKFDYATASKANSPGSSAADQFMNLDNMSSNKSTNPTTGIDFSSLAQTANATKLGANPNSLNGIDLSNINFTDINK